MTRRRVLWARSARRDLEAIFSYLAGRSPQAALSILSRLEARARSLATLSDRGRIVPELARLHIQEYRELVVPPYRILYRGRAPRVLVLAVLDARRSLEDILLDRLVRIEGQEL
jgi:plasmid stabilization system protein ParE